MIQPHPSSTLQLLAQRRFGPLFATQFLNAFNDNVFKNALLLLLAFQAGSVAGMSPAIAVQFAAGIFVLPFFLFSAMAGQLADRFEKSRLIRWVKLLEVFIALLGLAGFVFVQLEFLLFALFLMGLQSTLFGPLKYSILPQQLYPQELVAGNAWVESGTFVAILLGAIAAGLLMGSGPQGAIWCAALSVAVSTLGYLTSFGIPLAPAPAPDLKIRLNPFTETWRNVKLLHGNRPVFHATLTISWFWFYGAVFLTQFAPYVKEVLGGTENLVTVLLAAFIVGIAIGAFLCEKLSGKHVELGLVPLGAIGLSLFGIDLWLASPTAAPEAMSVAGFLAAPAHWRILVDLILIGASGGLFTVPLYAMVQQRSAEAERSRVIAANNILNAAFMVASALFGMVVLAAGVSISGLFLATALINCAVVVYICRLMPEAFVRFTVWLLLHFVYRIRVVGRENLPEEGAALLVCNHVSFMDAPIITTRSRRPVRFVIDHLIYRTPLFYRVFRAMGSIPVADPRINLDATREAYDEVSRALAAGTLVAIFPEGFITEDGEIGPFKSGVARILRRTPVPVVPMALRGLWGSFFSRKDGPAMRKPFRRGFWNRVELVIGKPIPADEATPARLREEVARLRGDWR
ncbi:MAG: glycerol acyltransferase [Candidatus Dactylopiibacterium carminicum]|uniref:Glycerol acyltransferase n=1 Tax=Candidatus Dactylopiibacterium carminicum TaxID=857335 RepID=A0A272EWK4_9RHOO|nr:MFS transporter [Candidatus Dactylopiibacterium carminicum]KAF7599935.1 glycerol acyltransferase [Candidatus Dactylopiibacterium carminicum]PAS94485.1 MAG: glycerol acyltransferase [Candidatus Dactylopiibacterium carminicum]PAS97031.1 MAG: glycerol acyltransferase [Candidatus Dactylopiibacterium carminicum]PAS99938.1 MAG: glycerol acyltransferase [Candidatus Dactylopiibacterium carminicum]